MPAAASIPRRAMSSALLTRSLRLLPWRVSTWVYYRSERYVWHQRDLTSDLPGAPALPDGVRLRSGLPADLAALDKIGMPMLERFEEFTGCGGELCIAKDADGPIAALWIFRARMPLYPWLELPDGVCALEHGTIAPGHRGRGLMPAVLGSVLERLSEEGYRSVAVKIMDTNRSSLRMVSKVGFRPIALMHQLRIIGRRRTIIEPASDFGYYLVQRLSGTLPWETGDPRR